MIKVFVIADSPAVNYSVRLNSPGKFKMACEAWQNLRFNAAKKLVKNRTQNIALSIWVYTMKYWSVQCITATRVNIFFFPELRSLAGMCGPIGLQFPRRVFPGAIAVSNKAKRLWRS